jgi:hypothetical protein
MRIRRVIRLDPGECVIICARPQRSRRPRPSRSRRPSYTTVTFSKTYRQRPPDYY